MCSLESRPSYNYVRKIKRGIGQVDSAVEVEKTSLT